MQSSSSLPAGVYANVKALNVAGTHDGGVPMQTSAFAQSSAIAIVSAPSVSEPLHPRVPSRMSEPDAALVLFAF